MRYADLQISMDQSVATVTQRQNNEPGQLQLEQIAASIKAINEQLSVLLLSHASASICRRRCEQKLDALMLLSDTHNVSHRQARAM